MNNKIRKISILVLSLLTVFAVACGDDEASTVSNSNKETVTIIETTAISETTETESVKTEKEEVTTTETQVEEVEEETEEADTDYKSAYINVIEENDFANSEHLTYDLIYFDEDDIPELVVCSPGSVSVYTYSNGNVYTLMDNWGFGAMGNAGYEYCANMNSMRNSNSDFAGAIRYTTYLSVNESFELETVNQYVTYMFDDKNDNDTPDDDEFIDEPKYFIDDREVTVDETEALNVGEYELIWGEKTLDELYSELQ